LGTIRGNNIGAVIPGSTWIGGCLDYERSRYRGLCPFAFSPGRQGALARTRPDDLAAIVVRGLLERTGVKAADIEDLIVGCAFPEGEQGFNIARLIGLIADLPLTVGA
jgi:acetyl-CoA acetyltransferase